ncbi:unnamed protein product [Linum trigynum]|uniref:Uncharacterized protein n=1 Tax=Linum trigynum TaxID=586398 RepID=A0AAV2EUX2_9ROSI
MKQDVKDSTKILRDMKLSCDKRVDESKQRGEIMSREVAELKKYKEESQRREEILRSEIHGLKKYNEALNEDLRALKTRWVYKLFGEEEFGVAGGSHFWSLCKGEV